MGGQPYDGGLPEVHDEAGKTPAWVHWVGLGLFGLIGLFAALRMAGPSSDAVEPDSAESAPEGAGAGEPQTAADDQAPSEP